MNPSERTQLIETATAARQQAYAPFSQFLVGAALLTTDGEIVTGCNVENASYGLTMCAERVAIGTAVAAGRRTFTAIAIATSNGSAPCGACRQVLAEFCADLPILLVAVDQGSSHALREESPYAEREDYTLYTVTETTLAKLFPGRFDL